MAGLGGLPYFIQAQGQLQAQQQAQQEQQMRLQQFQYQQAQQRQQQAAMAAAGNALPQLLAQPPQQQTPAPGQASQPMQQPGQQQPQMQPPPQGGQGVPLPGQGPAPGAVQPPLPPFRPMPTTPPQSAAAPQGVIPTPPQTQAAQTAPGAPGAQPAQLTLQSAIKALKDQGLSGADLFAGLKQLMPVLDAQSKQQAAQLQQQFNNELHLNTLRERHDEAVQRSQDTNRSIDERQQAAQVANQTRMTLGQLSASIKQQGIAQKLQGNPDSKLSPDDLQFMAQQYLAAPDPSIFTNLGRGAQGAQNVVGLRTAIMKEAKSQGLSGADVAALNIGVGAEKAAARTAGTKATNVALAANEAQQTFPLVRQASAALPRGEFVPANRAIQAAETNTGDPRVIALGTALNTAVNAYARAISPSGTPTVADKEHARDLLSAANTPAQIDAALSVMEKEMAAAQKAPSEVLNAQKQRISGRGATQSGPPVGTVEGGYRFKGGDPSQQSSWEKQ